MCTFIGFLVMENFASTSEIAEVRQRAEELVQGFKPTKKSVFSTKSQVHTLHLRSNP